MNDLVRIISIVTIALISTEVLSQEKKVFYRVEDNKYFHELSIRKLHDFKDEFNDDQEVLAAFNKFNSKRKIQRFINFVGVLITAPYVLPGCVLAVVDRSNVSPVYGSLCFAGIAFSGVFIIPANAIIGSQKGKHKKRLFNKMTQSDYYDYIDKYSFDKAKDDKD